MSGGENRAFIQGANRGIGLAVTEQLVGDPSFGMVFASCRTPEDAPALAALAERHSQRLRVVGLDVQDEASIARAADTVTRDAETLDLVMNVAGVLHGPDVSPEKKLEHVRPEALRHVFEVNAFGPLLVAKHFHALLRHDRRAVFASLSARIGSISDNRLGGWYAYRGSKAAQNMFTKTVSIELARIAPKAIVIGLHPGTVDTRLSKPFQRGVPDANLFSASESAGALLRVVSSVTQEDSGKVFDYRGDEILP